jgi:hypothetical protein
MDQDRHMGADRQGDGVRRPRIDVDLAAVQLGDDASVKNLILQLDDA